MDRGAPRMEGQEQREIGGFIESRFGIKMPAHKKALLEGRLARRLAACGFRSYRDYFRFVTEDPLGADEFLRFTDLVSTHETSFFREQAHFDYLSGTAIPSLCQDAGRRRLSLLSAACSSGEEAWSMGMAALDALSRLGRADVAVSLEGFDISTRMVEAARRAVYPEARAAPVPQRMRDAWLMRSKDREARLVRVVPELRALASFHAGNLLDGPGFLESGYDAIFCRNVLIYFGRADQARAIELLCSRLAPGGYLFLGHSESLPGLDFPVARIGHSIFRRK